jgi:fatty-acyl-CoA synthase
MNKLLLSNVFGAYSRRGKRFIQSGFDASYLQKCAANYVQLTPISFIERAALQYPKQLAYIHGKSYSVTWEETYLRVRKWASALYKQNIRKNDVISIIAPNTPSIFEAHFAIPGVSGVIHTINTRLDAKTIAFQLDHGSSKFLFVDTEFTTVISEALNILKAKGSKIPLVIYIHDKEYKTKNSEESNGINLEEFIASGDDNFALHHPADEWDAISLNYTSGTTGNPKGVVIHHRGAYLNSLSNLVEWNMHKFPQFLWVVPMFHCTQLLPLILYIIY